MMKDTYYTIAAPTEGEFKDRGSKFIAYAYPIDDTSEAQEYLTEVKKEHFKARHHCYAYRIGLDQNNFRANDDGEPSGTAGKPILGQLNKLDLTNTIVIVVRYFGGTKLGTSGLINAYRTATAVALEKANIIQKTVKDHYQITFDYRLMSDVMNALKKGDFEVKKQVFETEAVIEVAIPLSEVESKLLQLRAHIAKCNIAETDKLKNIEGLEIELLQ